MYEKTQEEYNRIGGYVDYYDGKVNWCRCEVDAKVQQLTEIKMDIEYARGCLDELNNSRTALKNIPFHANKWTGQNAEKFFSQCGEDSNLYWNYSKCIRIFEVLIDQMEEKAAQLESYIEYCNSIWYDFLQSYYYYLQVFEGYWWT